MGPGEKVGGINTPGSKNSCPPERVVHVNQVNYMQETRLVYNCRLGGQ
jgi:hypothetical protein